MATVPTPPTFAPGASSSTQLNQLGDAINFLMSPPRTVLRQTASQSISNSTWTSLTFGVEDVDTDPSGTGGHSTSVDTSRYTAVYAGWYWLGGNYSPAANATGRRLTRWAVNGTAINASQAAIQAATSSETSVAAVGKLVFLASGDYVELQAFQASGGSLGTQTGGEQQSGMSVVWKSIA